MEGDFETSFADSLSNLSAPVFLVPLSSPSSSSSFSASSKNNEDPEVAPSASEEPRRDFNKERPFCSRVRDEQGGAEADELERLEEEEEEEEEEGDDFIEEDGGCCEVAEDAITASAAVSIRDRADSKADSAFGRAP